MAVPWASSSVNGFTHDRWLTLSERKGLRGILRDVLVPCQELKPRNFTCVGIFVRAAHFKQRDADAFRVEFLRIVSEADQSWKGDPRRRPGGYTLANFRGRPIIGKYCERIIFLPRNSHAETVISRALDKALNDPEICRLWEECAQQIRPWREAMGLLAVDCEQAAPWIAFPLDAGAYSSQPALEALNDILGEKTAKYAPVETADLRLIVYYNDAVLYNTPYEDQEHETFAGMAREASRMLTERNANPFKKIYLLRALWPNPETFEIWLTISKCI
ncbi:MAG: hypothetical protein JO189_25910 [Deltaproteobacteria bacterium]|nr:hypothetical protein [Deltaproteobacteria bacterium]